MALLVAALAAAPALAHPLDPHIQTLFAEPVRMLRLVPMKLSHPEEMKTRWALMRLFGKAKLAAVEVRDVAGQKDLHDLDITIETVDLFGLNIQKLIIRARKVRFDPAELAQGQLVVANSFETEMVATVLEPDLNRASGPYSIDLMKETFRLEGESKVLFIESDFSLDGKLEIGEGNQVLLVPKALQYGVVPVPKMILKRVLAGVNPLFDLNKFLGSTKKWVDLDLSDPVLEDDHVVTTVSGRITPLTLAPPPTKSRGD